MLFTILMTVATLLCIAAAAATGNWLAEFGHKRNYTYTQQLILVVPVALLWGAVAGYLLFELAGSLQ